MAKPPSPITPQVANLAEKLLEDIRERGLRPGDRYLTTLDASRLLGVGNGAANRALQLLECRRVIVRQQRRGAFIDTLPDEGRPPPLHRVHFLTHPLFLRTEGLGNDQLLIGMQRELPGVHVQLSFLPSGDEGALVQQLIAEALASQTTDGFVLVRASCETQRLVAGSGLPAVVFGSVHPGVGELAFLDRDMYSGGRQLAEWLIGQGHERLAYLNRHLTYPGDHATIDAVSDALAAKKRRANALAIRCLPPDSEVCATEIVRLLERDDPPTGFICRTRRIAEAAEVAVERLGLRRRDIDVAVCDYYLKRGERARYVYPKPLSGEEEQGQHLARLLLAGLHRHHEQENHALIPVELEFPSARVSI